MTQPITLTLVPPTPCHNCWSRLRVGNTAGGYMLVGVRCQHTTTSLLSLPSHLDLPKPLLRPPPRSWSRTPIATINGKLGGVGKRGARGKEEKESSSTHGEAARGKRQRLTGRRRGNYYPLAVHCRWRRLRWWWVELAGWVMVNFSSFVNFI